MVLSGLIIIIGLYFSYGWNAEKGNPGIGHENPIRPYAP